MKSTNLIIVLLLILLFSNCSTTTENSNSKKETKMELTNKEKAVALLNSFNTGDQTPISYINPNKYIHANSKRYTCYDS